MRLKIHLAAWLLLSYAHAASLHEAFEQAWRARPQAQAQPARSEALSAQAVAAQAWTAQPPTLGLAHKTKRTDRSVREWELEVAVPLWQPGERGRQLAAVTAEQDAYSLAQQEARWQLAGEVRESWWQLQLAGSDAQIADRRLTEAAALSDDLARRLKAGLVARVDSNQAQLAKQAAQLAKTQAAAAWLRAQGDWQALTLEAHASTLQVDGAEAVAKPLSAPDESLLKQHPALLAAAARVASARASLDLVAVKRRESPELGLALTLERQPNLHTYEQFITLKLNLPMGGDQRNRPLLAAANAELIEAQARLEQLRRQLTNVLANATADLRQQHAAIAIASEGLELAQDSYVLLEKAYRLGNVDLPTRLRAESERFDAEQRLARAGLEAGRALARYQQALGVLP